MLLTSERAGDGTLASATATKANLGAVLSLLAGREVDERLRAGLPGGERLRAATPDDLVVLSFSGHGYTDARGGLYLLPYDVGPHKGRVEEILNKLHQHCGVVGMAPTGRRWRGGHGGRRLPLGRCRAAAGVQTGAIGQPRAGSVANDKGMRRPGRQPSRRRRRRAATTARVF